MTAYNPELTTWKRIKQQSPGTVTFRNQNVGRKIIGLLGGYH